MAYFKNFSQITYDYTIKTDKTPIVDTIVDLTERVSMNISKEDIKTLCDEYVIPTGITPEQIAASLYNDPFLHWTILYVNGIANLSSEWPVSENVLSTFVTKKYGFGNEYNTHHYEKMPEGIVIDSKFCIDIYGETPVLVTNYDHEFALNEQKRIILVIKPVYISSFVNSFENAKIGVQ